MVKIDGIYTAYMTGIAGQGIAMFVFTSGRIAGADVSGIIFEGDYEVSDQRVVGEIRYVMPPGTSSITGVTFEQPSEVLRVTVNLPCDLKEGETYRIETTIGPVNARFVKNVALS